MTFTECFNVIAKSGTYYHHMCLSYNFCFKHFFRIIHICQDILLYTDKPDTLYSYIKRKNFKQYRHYMQYLTCYMIFYHKY